MDYIHIGKYKYFYDPWKRNEGNKKAYSIHSQGKKNKFRLYIFSQSGLLTILRRVLNILGDKCSGNIVKFFNTKNFLFFLIVVVIFFTWAISGFYIIKEAERGVLLRFGKYHHLVQPGLNWRPMFIDLVIPVNVETVRELAASGMMLTSDENVVKVEMNVQYRVTSPKNYLFNVTNADDSLRQATDSALRGVIGKYNMDRILTEGRTVVRIDTRRILEKTIRPYNMGITLLDVNFQTARPPEEVKAAFDDAIAARENEQQYIREAEAYANEVQPRANGQAQRILEEGRAYKIRTILEAQGEAQRFSSILPEYRVAPKITRERLYINSMERILSNTKKIFINSKNIHNILLLPTGTIDLGKDNNKLSHSIGIGNVVDNNCVVNQRSSISDISRKENNYLESMSFKDNSLSNCDMNTIVSPVITEKSKCQDNTQRVDIVRKGRES